MLLDGSCWRIFKFNDGYIVSMAGPILYYLSFKDNEPKVSILADLRDMAEKHGWWFPHGPAHITDFLIHEDKLVATVEVGGLIFADIKSPLKWRIAGLDGVDAHNILKARKNILVASASGIHISSDLHNWRKAKGSRGYIHALEMCGNLLISHKMNDKPIIISDDDGENWRELEVKMDYPTYGQTCLKCIQEGLIMYAPSNIYLVNLHKKNYLNTRIRIPRIRRIIDASLFYRP